jgi:energy-coupling factor transporter ATP-binding protein EcfA2
MNYFKDCDQFIIETGEKLIIFGKTGGGKSTFVRNLINHRDIIFREKVTKIIYAYQYAQPWFEELANEVEFTTIIPDHIDPIGHNVLVVDDAREQDFEAISQWFLRGARHSKTTIIFIYQSVFNSNSDSFKRIVNNTDIFIFHYFPKGIHQLSILFRQFLASKDEVREALNLYKEAMQTKYNYLIFDVRQSVKYQFRLNIFCEHGDFQEAVKI